MLNYDGKQYKCNCLEHDGCSGKISAIATALVRMKGRLLEDKCSRLSAKSYVVPFGHYYIIGQILERENCRNLP